MKPLLPHSHRDRGTLFVRLGLIVAGLGAIGLLAFDASSRSASASALQRAELLVEAHGAQRSHYARQIAVPLRTHGVDISGAPGEGVILFPLELDPPVDRPGVHFRVLSPYVFPCRPGVVAPSDPGSDEAWNRIAAEPGQSWHAFEDSQAGRRLRYVAADRVTPECSSCHATLSAAPEMLWQEGDVVGLVEVTLPVDGLHGPVLGTIATTLGWIGLFAALWAGGLLWRGRRLGFTRDELEERVLDRTVELQTRETKTRSMIEAALDAVICVDDHGRVTEWNRHAEIDFGWTRREALGKRIESLIIPERHREAHVEGFRRFLAAEPGTSLNRRIEIEAHNREGVEFPIELAISASQHDGRTQFHAFVRDITEQKKAESDLQDAKLAAEVANRAKSAFLANMSHEIRTPMTAIIGFADVLIEEGNLEDAAPEVVRAVETIRQNGEYLVEIINDILDISKIEAGKLEVERIPCSVVQIVAEVKSLMAVRAQDKNLGFTAEYSGPIPATVQSDPVRMRQILVNLIGNALKFTETGAVRLVVRFDEPQIHFDVIDSGIGLTEEHAARLFEPFAQADVTTSRTFGGTGLGLTISKRLAEMLGGDVVLVESQWGSGSRFRASVHVGSLAGVVLLADPGAASTAGPEAPQSDRPLRLDDFRILLAEDGPDNQRLVSHILRKVGAEVTIVENGQLAFDAALKAKEDGQPFDVILMDMQMPVMDGYQATRRLRDARYSGAIVALTAHAMAGDREKCVQSGCDDYATKPINRQKLIHTISGNVQREPLPASPDHS